MCINKFIYIKMNEISDERFYPNKEQNWIFANQNKNLEVYHSSQEFSFYDIKIPIYYEIPSPEPEDFDSIPFSKEEIIETFKGEPDTNFRKVVFKVKKQLRGRKRKETANISQIKPHDKISKDNILRKFNVCFLTFVIQLANTIVECFGYKGKFLNLDYNFKKNITKKFLKKLKNLTFGELLCENISKKFRKHSYNENKQFYELVIKNKNIEKIFSEKYMSIFDLFKRSQRLIKVGDDDYYLSPKIGMFDTFLLSIKNKYQIDDTSLYIKKIKEIVEDY